jgi:hypothetical protein
LPKQDAFLVPDSLFIKHTCAVVTTTPVANMLGTPVYTPFIRLETVSNGTYLESQFGFNFVQNMVTHLTQNGAQLAGAGNSYGFSYTDNNTSDTDGRTLSANTGETWNMSAPLSCILSNCKKYIPMI